MSLPKYVVWLDFETTGFHRFHDRVIQWAAQVSYADAALTPVGSWSTLVCPSPYRTVPRPVSRLTGITSAMLQEKDVPRFGSAYDAFQRWLSTQIVSTDDEDTTYVFMAHNGLAFDYAILWNELLRLLQRSNHDSPEDKLRRDFPGLTHLMDSLAVAKAVATPPDKKYNLGHLYQWCFGAPLSSAHNATADVEATRLVMRELGFGGMCQTCMASLGMEKKHRKGTRVRCICSHVRMDSCFPNVMQRYAKKYGRSLAHSSASTTTIRSSTVSVSQTRIRPNNTSTPTDAIPTVTPEATHTPKRKRGNPCCSFMCEQCRRILSYYFRPHCYACDQKKNTD